VFVVTAIDQPTVVAYYAWCMASVGITGLPERLRRGAGRYPQPIALLARLGVDERHEGQGLGAGLLLDVISRVASLSNTPAVTRVFPIVANFAPRPAAIANQLENSRIGRQVHHRPPPHPGDRRRAAGRVETSGWLAVGVGGDVIGRCSTGVLGWLLFELGGSA
jgi:hypothetical protein